METNDKVKNAIIWIDGLSTTTKKQGKSVLGDAFIGFCCLGYGCYKTNQEYNVDDPYSIPFSNSVGLIKPTGSAIDPKTGIGIDNWLTVLNMTGIKPLKREDKQVHLNYITLLQLNDEYNLTFKEISSILKNNVNYFFIPEVSMELNKHYNKKDTK